MGSIMFQVRIIDQGDREWPQSMSHGVAHFTQRYNARTYSPIVCGLSAPLLIGNASRHIQELPDDGRIFDFSLGSCIEVDSIDRARGQRAKIPCEGARDCSVAAIR